MFVLLKCFKRMNIPPFANCNVVGACWAVWVAIRSLLQKIQWPPADLRRGVVGSRKIAAGGSGR